MPRAATLATPFLLVVAALLVACRDEPRATPTPSPAATAEATSTPSPPAATPSPTPSPTPEPDPRADPRAGAPSVGLDARGIPAGATGTVIVYAKQLPAAFARYEVATFDLAAARRLSEFAVEDPNPVTFQLAGTRLIVEFVDAIWTYALDGSDALLLYEGGVTAARPAPDGALIAYTCGNRCGAQQTVWIAETATGRVLQQIDMAAIDGWRGEVWPAAWTADGGLILEGLCNCDGPQAAEFPTAVLQQDGTLAFVDASPYEPVAHLAFAGGFGDRCALVYGGTTSATLVDASGAPLASTATDAPVIVGGEVSPAGDEALVYVVQAEADLAARLNDEVARGLCPESAEYGPLDEAPREVRVLHAGSSDVTTAPDRLSVMEDWYDGRIPVFACEGEERAGYLTYRWLRGERWVDPAGFGAPWGFSSPGCDGRSARLDMRAGRVAVDAGGAGYDVLALLEAGDR